MERTEIKTLTKRLSALLKRAEGTEEEACYLLNKLAAGLIPTTPELTDEAAHHLKNGSLHTLSRAISSIMEVARHEKK